MLRPDGELGGNDVDYLLDRPWVLAAVLVLAIGFVLRPLRDYLYRNKTVGSSPAPVASDPEGHAGADTEYVIRKIRPKPEKNPPVLRLSANTLELTYQGKSEIRPLSEVELTFKPATMFGVNFPTAVIKGFDAKLRGRVTTDPRPPFGQFDSELEEQMARHLLQFLALAKARGATVISKQPLPEVGDEGEAHTLAVTRLRWSRVTAQRDRSRPCPDSAGNLGQGRWPQLSAGAGDHPHARLAASGS